jgi:hypothetical protein
MKRWACAVLAVLFLSTATLHVFAHHGAADSDCGVCSVQQASLPSAPAPIIAAGPALVADLVQPDMLLPRSARPVAAAARAPPLPPA